MGKDPRAAQSVEDELLHRVQHLLVSAVGTDVVGVIAQDHLATGGKRMRARLCMDAARALSTPPGAALDAAVVWAAAIEMIHNASLIHDDLQDGDRVRRGVPTTWAVHGAAQAINTGDLMLALPYRMLRACSVSAETRWYLVDVLAGAVEDMTRGQANEPALRTSMTWDSYLHCVRGKTGALVGASVHGAALIAGRTRTQAIALAAPFVRIGEIFQMQDDVLDAFGDKGRGRSGSDLDEGKVSSLVVAHLRRYPDQQSALCQVLDAPRGTAGQQDIDAVIASFDAGGALDDVLARMQSAAQDVSHAAALQLEPALQKLADAWVARVLEPIAHVIAARQHARTTEAA